MKEPYTEQIIDGDGIEIESKDLGLTIRCNNCGTGRTFAISENLANVVHRTYKGFGIKTFCEHCGIKIGVSIGWINKDDKYSYKKPDEAFNDFSVLDKNGLGEFNQ